MKVVSTVVGKDSFVKKETGEVKYFLYIGLSEFSKEFGLIGLDYFRVEVDNELYNFVGILDVGFADVIEYNKDNRMQKIVRSFCLM